MATKHVVIIGTDTYTLDQSPSFTTVSRAGEMPFRQGYEDHDEAVEFYDRCVGAAIRRHQDAGGVVTAT